MHVPDHEHRPVDHPRTVDHFLHYGTRELHLCRPGMCALEQLEHWIEPERRVCICEYVWRVLHAGCHDVRLFLPPLEFSADGRKADFGVCSGQGIAGVLPAIARMSSSIYIPLL